MKPLLFFAALLPGSALMAVNTPAEVFQMNCSACHAVDHMLVGPSLVEISGIYRGNPDGFLKWCIQPQHKREGVIEMPSMAHLGEPVLRQLHAYILDSAAGKTELKKSDGDPFSVPRAMVRRPQVQRIFMPDASPAAIAVAMPGDLSYCFDASECRLRYVWKGGFIDGFSYWKANGSSLAKIDGSVVYNEPAFPLSIDGKNEADPPKFLGYKVGKDGNPAFRYIRNGVTFTETIKPSADGAGIERHFDAGAAAALKVLPLKDASIESSTGSPDITPEQSKSFTLTLRWK